MLGRLYVLLGMFSSKVIIIVYLLQNISVSSQFCDFGNNLRSRQVLSSPADNIHLELNLSIDFLEFVRK